jgi:hypothetical protein
MNDEDHVNAHQLAFVTLQSWTAVAALRAT